MNAHTAERSPHLGDGDLLRLLDRDDDNAQLARWETHISQCGECAAAFAELRADADTISEWLERAAFEADLPAADDELGARRVRRKAPRPLPPWLRVAAVLALIAAPLAALPSVRSWVARSLGSDGTVTAVSTTADPAQPDGAPVRFAPAAGEFVVTLEAPQQRGLLRIRRGDGTDARFSVDGELPDGAVVSAAALLIRNTTGSEANYVLELPPHVTRVAVHVGTSSIAVIEADAITAGANVRLSER